MGVHLTKITGVLLDGGI